MIAILVDMGLLWLLLNIFSDDDWDDEKLKVFGIALAISIFGGLAAGYSMNYLDPLSALGAYFLVGVACLWALASLEIRKAALAMGIFTVFKVVVALVFTFLLSD